MRQTAKNGFGADFGKPISDDELAALLPFFMSGHISPRDRDRVIEGLNARANAGEIIANAESELNVLRDAHEEIAPRPDALQRLLADVESTPQDVPRALNVPDMGKDVGGWFSKLLDFGNARPALAWGLAALLLVTAVGQFGLLLGRQGVSPQTPKLAGQSNCQDAVCALVGFKREATLADIQDALVVARGRIIGQRQAFFLVKFETGAGAKGLESLKSRGSVVTRVLPLGKGAK